MKYDPDISHRVTGPMPSLDLQTGGTPTSQPDDSEFANSATLGGPAQRHEGGNSGATRFKSAGTGGSHAIWEGGNTPEVYPGEIPRERKIPIEYDARVSVTLDYVFDMFRLWKQIRRVVPNVRDHVPRKNLEYQAETFLKHIYLVLSHLRPGEAESNKHARLIREVEKHLARSESEVNLELASSDKNDPFDDWATPQGEMPTFSQCGTPWRHPAFSALEGNNLWGSSTIH